MTPLTIAPNYIHTGSSLSNELKMTPVIIKDNVIYNALAGIGTTNLTNATHLLTMYPSFEDMREGYIALKIAKRLHLNTIKFKVFKIKTSENHGEKWGVLLVFDKDMKRFNDQNTPQSVLYDSFNHESRKEFFKYLAFNFLIYNINYTSHDIHWYPKTKTIGPLLDISIYDKSDKEKGDLFGEVITSIITPAKEYLPKEFIRDTIVQFSDRLYKMLSNKRMLLFYDKEILNMVLRHIKLNRSLVQKLLKS